jgi:ribonuclease HI
MKVAVYVDGGCAANPGPTACAAVAIAEDNTKLWEKARALGHGTNNTAEYGAVSLGVELAVLLGADEAHFFSDSQLIVNQLLKWWAVNGELHQIHGRTAGMLMEIPHWSIGYVPRAENSYADMLVNTIIRPTDKRADRSRVELPGYRENAHIREGWASMEKPKPKAGVKPFEVVHA